MAELLGIIAPLKKFMSNSDEEVYIPLDGKKRVVLSLKEDRIYNIPDFQREIRWNCDNVSVLVEDIKSGPKFLGNIILTMHSPRDYSIIDGQQRITILTMILSCIKGKYNGEIEIIEPCKLKIESFLKFSELIDAAFERRAFTKEVIKSDKLKQISKYEELWNYISEMDEFKNKRVAKQFIENLGACNFNVIINGADDVGEGIRYFIDVNLKGKQLDVEDIFKSYLFKNDSSIEIREQWYILKTLVAEIDDSKMEYTLLKLLEHYFLCDLYSSIGYKGMEFGTDFLLKKAYKDGDVRYREGTHIIELINSNQYMKTSLVQLNKIIKWMLEFVNSESITKEIKSLFVCNDANGQIDNEELKVIHNIICKILRDAKILPKALLIKYFIMLLYGKNGKSKERIRTIYGIYLFTVLFTVFESKKSADVLLNIIKASESKWYEELVKQINDYFNPDRITDTRLLAQYKFGQNEDEEDQRFRCKSLATIYNYFINQNGTVSVRKGKMKDLYKFITDDNAFSVEHLIISDTKSKNIIVQGKQYTIDETIYKRYINNFFNFIFISQNLNSQLGNNWLPEKLAIIKKEEISCEYSKMIISKLGKMEKAFINSTRDDYPNNLDLFFYRDYKDLYIEYTKSALDDIIKRIKGCSDAIERK